MNIEQSASITEEDFSRLLSPFLPDFLEVNKVRLPDDSKVALTEQSLSTDTNFSSFDFSIEESSDDLESDSNLSSFSSSIATADNRFPKDELNSSIALNNNPNVLVVTTSEDQNDGSSTNGLALRDAILIANQNPSQQYEIILEAGVTYTLELNGTGEFSAETGDLNINQGNNLTIKAVGGEENATISASALTERDRVFYVTRASTLNLENITVADGEFNDRGGNFRIADDSVVNLTDVEVVEGNAENGGGMFISDSTVTLNNSIVRNNSASKGGGIMLEKTSIDRDLSLIVNNSEIINNQATSTNGGGLHNQAGAIELNNSRVADNTSRAGGSGIYTRGQFENINTAPAQLTISNSEFTGNNIEDGRNGGGAIYSPQSTRIEIVDSVFADNIVETDSEAGSNTSVLGAAIRTDSNSTLSITESTFSGNQATDNQDNNWASGGAIASNNSSVEIRHSIFENNSANGEGGALVSDAVDYENIIENTVFRNNSANFGGAVNLNGNSTVTDSQLENNHAIVRGGGASVGGTSNWSRVQIRGNRVEEDPFFSLGGGLSFGTGNHVLTEINVENNRTSRYGAGIAAEDATVTIENSTIQDNEANEVGGGVFTEQNATVNINNSEILNNKAVFEDGGGGAFAVVRGSSANITNSIIDGNIAHAGAGVFSLEHDNNSLVTIADTRISNNQAIVGGGIFGKFGAEFEIDRTLLVNNFAQEAGGASIGANATAQIRNTTFSNNTAADEGSALYIGKQEGFNPPGEVRLNSSTITNNTANSENGNFGQAAIYVNRGTEEDIPPSRGGIVNLDNSIIAGNFNAPNDAGSIADSPDIFGEIASGSHNIIGDGTGSEGLIDGIDSNQIGDRNNPLDPGLASLADNGGQTQTHALVNDSIAINAGDNSLVDRETDQRGFERIVGGTVDIGAFELQDGEEFNLPEPEPQQAINLFRFRNTTFDTGTYVFVGEAEKNNILADENLSNTFSLDGIQEDGTVNPAFTASTTSGDNLIPFYRLKSLDVPGTFLFVSTAEYDAIFAGDSDQRNKWEQEGLNSDGEDIPEFYILDGASNLGIEFNRFQNNQNGTFLYAAEAETNAIESNPNLSNLFTNQGVAFKSLV